MDNEDYHLNKQDQGLRAWMWITGSNEITDWWDKRKASLEWGALKQSLSFGTGGVWDACEIPWLVLRNSQR